jgi:imidazoleglycerol-phosphate dehydratase
MARTAEIKRKTNETDISLGLNIDGSGISKINTGIPFLDHMLDLMTVHGFLDVNLKARGDRQVDDHHTVEDLGICLGKGLNKALGEREGIARYGEATVPMDEALVRVVLDLSNRPFLGYRVPLKKRTSGTFDVGLVKEFFRSLVINGGMTLHVDLLEGEEPHHISEAIFKAFARALDKATVPENRLGGNIPSTKGLL